jgi:hypothetical protein
MIKFSWNAQLLGIAALFLALAPWPPAHAEQPFTIEIQCTIPLNNYICVQTGTPSTTKSFVIETVSFSGQATLGQTVGGNFSFKTGRKAAVAWLPVQSLGASPSAGTGVYVATLPVRLILDPGSPIRMEVYRNSTANSGQNTPYSQRLNLMGYLQ